MSKDTWGKLLILCAITLAIVCLLTPSIFKPDGDLYEPYILSRNLLILSLLNWFFFLGVKFIGSQK